MTTQTEALHKALKVLNCLNNGRVYETAWVKGAITACEEVLQSQEQGCSRNTFRQHSQEQEPVLIQYFDKNDETWENTEKKFVEHYKDIGYEIRYLYTHPKEWQELSDNENNAIIKKIWIWGNDFPHEKYRIAIEQALKEKNT